MIRHSSPYKTGGSPPSHLFRSGPQAAVPIRDPSVDGTGGASVRGASGQGRRRGPRTMRSRTNRFRACSSGWLERTPDKREVGSSSLPRPTIMLERGCSSVGRAPALQAGGRRFNSVHLHQPRRLSDRRAPERRPGSRETEFPVAHPRDRVTGTVLCHREYGYARHRRPAHRAGFVGVYAVNTSVRRIDLCA